MRLYNEAASSMYKNDVLEKCPGCHRTFFPEVIAKHMKMCIKEEKVLVDPFLKLNKPRPLCCIFCRAEISSATLLAHIKICKKKSDLEKQKIEQEKENQEKFALKSPFLKLDKPRPLCCILCRAELSSATFDIHKKTCKKKIEEESKSSKRRKGYIRPMSQIFNYSEGLNVSAPITPQSGHGHGGFEAFSAKKLKPCTGCNRKFIPDSLITHQKICKDYIKLTTPKANMKRLNFFHQSSAMSSALSQKSAHSR